MIRIRERFPAICQTYNFVPVRGQGKGKIWHSIQHCNKQENKTCYCIVKIPLRWEHTAKRGRGSGCKRHFAVSHSRGTKPACWRAKVALGQGKQKAYIILNDNFLYLSCPSTTFALQHGGFVQRGWLAAKGLFHTTHCILTAQTSK